MYCSMYYQTLHTHFKQLHFWRPVLLLAPFRKYLEGRDTVTFETCVSLIIIFIGAANFDAVLE